MGQPFNHHGGAPFNMQGFENALPDVLPQQYDNRQHAGQQPLQGTNEYYGRHPAYSNPQGLHGHQQQAPNFGHPYQQQMIQPTFEDYAAQYGMPAMHIVRPVMSGMQRPQVYPHPGSGHGMQGNHPGSGMPIGWASPHANYPNGPYPGPNVMTYGHKAPNSAQLSPAPFAEPRGPPRKPRQSGFALWVGNLPPAASIADLKDHFSREATKDIESLFLIAKSNCAFVNYRTEAACTAAMHRFHDSRFNGIRLVCRLRKGAASTSLASPPGPSEVPSLTHSSSAESEAESIQTPTIVGGPPTSPLVADGSPAENPHPKAARVPETFFVLKSLTTQDLDASVRRGEWTTQVHNEAALNAAFERAENVYLIFSANKSGEYFGYARMLAPISGDPATATSPTAPLDALPVDGPLTISTPATATAPPGRIIDDTVRGTIFWEADTVEEEDGSPVKEQSTNDLTAEQDLGRPFRVEWITTTRLPFFRTRGLRNAWNANREVKIARDGTELEPLVGRKLMLLFHGVGS